MDNKKSDIINKRKYHQPKAVVKGKDGKVINILENNHTKEKNSEKESALYLRVDFQCTQILS